MSGPVCVDASLFLCLVFDDPRRAMAARLWDGWLSSGREMIAPPLFHAEVTSVIRRRSHQGELSAEDARGLLSACLRSPVDIWPDSAELQPRALDLAERFRQPTAYDTQYVALTGFLGGELWTADRRLVEAVSGELPWVHYVGEAA